MDNKREKLGSRLGFILLSAGCAIGLGNVWTFPWRVGQSGGGAFVLVYVLCAALVGLPIMVGEFALGRAAQASPVKMYQKLERKGQKWHLHGYLSLAANFFLMMFYTTIAGYFFYYFIKFIGGNSAGLTFDATFTNPKVNVIFMAVVVILGFAVLSFNMQKGLERVTKYMMILLFVLLGGLAVHSCMLSGVKEGLSFYLKPDFSKINGQTLVAAMNQSFFSLSIGIGSMAIFGSYIGKDRALLGESVNVIALDTLVALLAGIIIFPACYTYGIEPNAGPKLLFTTMTEVFNDMTGGRIWGSLFFLFMIFAAMSTVFAVFENILACVRELTGWSRKKGCVILCIAMLILCLPMALGGSVLSWFVPFAEGTGVLDLWVFLVETISQPVGSIVLILFCCSRKWGWGWDNFIAEANTGKGLKIRKWMKFYICYIVPAIVAFIFVYGLITFGWR